jgi:histidine phosphotransferase ChpT
MEPTIELNVAELLASRLCHDLISPVGAVNSGIELLTEFGGDPDGESMALISSSARTASDKLLFFRIAYGNAGSGTNVPLSEGLALVAPVCLNHRTEAVIDDASAGAMPGAGAVKLLLCLALMAGESLPRAGTLTVRVGPHMRTEITASGGAHGSATGSVRRLRVKSHPTSSIPGPRMPISRIPLPGVWVSRPMFHTTWTRWSSRHSSRQRTNRVPPGGRVSPSAPRPSTSPGAVRAAPGLPCRQPPRRESSTRP